MSNPHAQSFELAYALVYVAGNLQIPLHVSDMQDGHVRWLKSEVAAEIILENPPSAEDFKKWQEKAALRHIDVFLVPANAYRRKKLLLADMDATIVVGETLDDLADAVGLKSEIAAITERAMRGEIDFKEALEERVGKLKGLHVEALQETLTQMQLTKGAQDMVTVMRHYGATCVLVSGGFTFFTDAISKQCRFQFHHGNTLEIEAGKLTGHVLPPLLDKQAKLVYLTEYTAQLELNTEDTLAVGDGANDIPMLLGAGLGIGYKPKPLVKEHVQNCIVYSDHMALLYVQGYNWSDITTALSAS